MIEPPESVMDVALATGLKVPPQVLVAAGVEKTVMPVGKVSVKPMPVMEPESVAGSVMVMVKVVAVPDVMEVGLKALVAEGGAVTVRVAVLDATPVPPFAEVGALVVLL